MFDLGFWELALVVLVGLVVIGPERLPHVMRTTGNWLGRLRGMSMTVRRELEQELYREDLSSQGINKTPFGEVKQIIDETGAELNSIGQELTNVSEQSVDKQSISSADTLTDDK